jgi:hypothetical protein
VIYNPEETRESMLQFHENCSENGSGAQQGNFILNFHDLVLFRLSFEEKDT